MWARREELECVPRHFRRSAFQWEAQGIYYEPCVPFQRWRAGLDDTVAMWEWLEPSRAAIAAGKQVRRVAAFADPLTEYQQWQISVAPRSQAAGETVGWMRQDEAMQLDMPADDFWLLDDELVAVLVYREHMLVGAEVTAEPATVHRYCEWRDLACRLAKPPPHPHSSVPQPA